MISDQAYLWFYLPGQTEPVVCGIVAFDGQDHVFRYARSYLQRDNAIPLAPPNCTLGALDNEEHILDDELNSAIRDASPDAWGRNIMLREHANAPGRSNRELGEIDFLLRAGPDRIGALDATDTPSRYIPKEGHAAPLAELLEAADRIDQGRPLDDQLDAALNHGTSVGGARPKALLHENGEFWIAKFSSSRDSADMVGIEDAGMALARLAGIRVAETRIVESLNKRVILVRRFDRTVTPGGVQRRHMISAMTLLGLDEYAVRAGHSSYLELADMLRQFARDFRSDGAELFRRMVFNMLIGNVDDHARNHACFWDGECLELTPAYDVCPQPRTGVSADQAMIVGAWGRQSNLQNALSECERFGLGIDEATEIVETMTATVRNHWEQVFADSGVPEGDRQYLSRATILGESVFYELS
ncbi:type II toxin-antitoxin system HipA family toxin [Natronospirillum operosum]|uniref:Type II toxin-antitoxin system HipA family toxin n=1 Tax=Natronospirillum operosum TaxID=2759953 RepID=A0A4Z0W772_9GAMM|nr:HipA domain-containing protein [Natronospirillum operosum]TGG93894.1 type II toxin-antitoxin system HipA family toxin [Natronospirillum operosum]